MSWLSVVLLTATICVEGCQFEKIVLQRGCENHLNKRWYWKKAKLFIMFCRFCDLNTQEKIYAVSA